MTSPQFSARACRPRDHLAAAGRLYPRAWSDIEHMRAHARGQTVADWPAWCYLPIAGAQAAVANYAGLPVELLGSLYPQRIVDAARLAAMAAWRMTQGIYRFDPALYDAVRDTPIDGDIPHDVLYRFPEWCVYIETPGLMLGTDRAHGVFAHLEHDMRTSRPELRLVFDADAEGGMMLIPVPIHLGPWSLPESLDRMMDTASATALERGLPDMSRARSTVLRAAAEPVLALLLYLCSQASEIDGRKGQPGNPTPSRTRRDGWKLFPASGPSTWEVGVRIGAALRRAYQAEQTRGGPGNAPSSPRPHIRRAHWHTILSGPRMRNSQPMPAAERNAELRWMPPIAVNLDDGNALPATIRSVR